MSETTDRGGDIELSSNKPKGQPFLKPLYGFPPYQYTGDVVLMIVYEADKLREISMRERSFLIALTTLCLLVGIVSAAQTPTYKTYSNARFAYSISYPANLLKPQGEAENGDGQAFRSADGHAVMRVWGGYNANNESLRAVYDQAVNELGAGVSYKAIKPGWFVVSALVNGKIHYRKTMLRKDVLKTFEIEYDESQKATYDPVTARIAKSFVG